MTETLIVSIAGETKGYASAIFKVLFHIERISSCLFCKIHPSFGPRNINGTVALNNTSNQI